MLFYSASLGQYVQSAVCTVSPVMVSRGCNVTGHEAPGCADETTTVDPADPSADSDLERSLGFLVIGGIGIVSNLFVICVLCSSATIRKKIVNVLIVHQSFVDLLSSAALVGTAHLDAAADKHGLSGVHADIYCFFIASKWPLWTLMMTSSFSLIFLNVERYVSIVFPIFHHTKVTRRKILMLLPIVWVLGFLEDSLVASAFVSNGESCGLGTKEYHAFAVWVTLVLYIVLHFFLPVALVMFLYGHMMIRLRKSVTKTQEPSSTASSSRDVIVEKAKKNVFKTMLLITLCYAICYAFNCVYIALFLPGIISTLSGECERKERPRLWFWLLNAPQLSERRELFSKIHRLPFLPFAGQFYSFTVYMVCANAIVNPFVYAIQYHEFQQHVQHLLGCGRSAEEDTSLATNSVALDKRKPEKRKAVCFPSISSMFLVPW